MRSGAEGTTFMGTSLAPLEGGGGPNSAPRVAVTRAAMHTSPAKSADALVQSARALS
jgi:hypothetical protein